MSKHIVIFGGASAIAQATARIWASKGASFVLVDSNEDAINIVADDLKTRGAKDVQAIAADLSNIHGHQDLMQRIYAHGKPTTYLIAYGTLGDQKRGEQDFAVAQKELEINFLSVASLLTHITNTKHEHPATVVVISSVAGDRGRQSNYIYGTAKGALTTWLSGLRNRLTRENANIHVLTVKPGFVDTPMTAEFKKGLLWVKPEKIAHDIVRAVANKKDVVYTPWFWRCIMCIIRHIPEPIFKKMGL